ncbi:MAG: TetR family transcriptional regulator [Xanthomonadales bacterium]|nr:TetR family transcriptional regulator [Xanthomonadales bacterium]
MIRSSKKRSRRPGPSGTQDIPQRILDSAEYLFAAQGFAATSVREIAERVDVNAAMVHYYFGSKRKLLEAVMERVLTPLASAIEDLEQQERLEFKDLAGLIFAMAGDHPYLPQLMTREVFLPGGGLQQEFLDHFAPRLGGRLPAMLKREQQAGRIAPEHDPRIMTLLILSACLFPFIARPVAESALGMNYDSAGLEKLLAHVTVLVEQGFGK